MWRKSDSRIKERKSLSHLLVILMLIFLSCLAFTACNIVINNTGGNCNGNSGNSSVCSTTTSPGNSTSTANLQSGGGNQNSSFPTDPTLAAQYLGITTDDASFRAIPDGAGPDTLIGWQISANRDITVSIGSYTCIDLVIDPNNTHVTTGTFTKVSSTRIRSTSQVQIFLPSGYQLSFYKTPC